MSVLFTLISFLWGSFVREKQSIFKQVVNKNVSAYSRVRAVSQHRRSKDNGKVSHWNFVAMCQIDVAI
jgi:hypothetical protein